jgi:hypothetical protein
VGDHHSKKTSTPRNAIKRRGIHVIIKILDDPFDQVFSTSKFTEMIKCGENFEFLHQSAQRM